MTGSPCCFIKRKCHYCLNMLEKSNIKTAHYNHDDKTVRREIKPHIRSSEVHKPSFTFNKHCTSAGNGVSLYWLISRGKQIEASNSAISPFPAGKLQLRKRAGLFRANLKFYLRIWLSCKKKRKSNIGS